MSDFERQIQQIEECDARRDYQPDLPGDRQAHRRSGGHMTARAAISRCGHPLRQEEKDDERA